MKQKQIILRDFAKCYFIWTIFNEHAWEIWEIWDYLHSMGKVPGPLSIDLMVPASIAHLREMINSWPSLETRVTNSWSWETNKKERLTEFSLAAIFDLVANQAVPTSRDQRARKSFQTGERLISLPVSSFAWAADCSAQSWVGAALFCLSRWPWWRLTHHAQMGEVQQRIQGKLTTKFQVLYARLVSLTAYLALSFGDFKWEQYAQCAQRYD